MERSFVYGISVDGENFTDRIEETKRLKLNFENGINTIIISPRRMGKTSLVKRVIRLMDKTDIRMVYMDVYDCRSGYDFYNKFAESVLQQSSGKVEQWLDNAKDFMARISPKISVNPDMSNEYSLSLGITPKTYSPEEILNLPELIAVKKHTHIVVCIDEFQQIGELPDSLEIQKRLRGVWQHQKNTSFCLFGSKKHLMTKLFQNKRMPFYQFGEMMFLDKIPTDDWVQYIQSRFESKGKMIDEKWCREICRIADNNSSYVQQLSWNVMAETDKIVGAEQVESAKSVILSQCGALFEQQLSSLSRYQIGFLKAIANGYHTSFTSKKIMEEFQLGSKSNISRLQSALIEKEILETKGGEYHFADPIFAVWFEKNYAN